MQRHLDREQRMRRKPMHVHRTEVTLVAQDASVAVSTFSGPVYSRRSTLSTATGLARLTLDKQEPEAERTASPPATPNRALAIRLSMAMFVLVVDTSLMNVSISAVVQDLNTTVSGVQSAIALEALVSAAFILIGGKIGDLYGRKRAYVLGLLGYAAGAVAMTFAQGLTALIVFWAIIGGLGAALLLPSMQSLIHGNFEGAERTRAYAQVGAAAAIATAVGPLLGGFITTFLSWRVGFLLEAVLIAIVLSGIHLVRDVPYTGPRQVDALGAVLSVLGMGGIVLSILVWQEGGERVRCCWRSGLLRLGGWSTGCGGASAEANRRCSTRSCSSRCSSGWASRSRCSSRSLWAA